MPACQLGFDVIPDRLMPAHQSRRHATAGQLTTWRRLGPMAEVIIRRQVKPARHVEPAMPAGGAQLVKQGCPAIVKAHNRTLTCVVEARSVVSPAGPVRETARRAGLTHVRASALNHPRPIARNNSAS